MKIALLSLLLTIFFNQHLFAQKKETKGIFYSLGAGLLIADNTNSYFYDGRPIRDNSIKKLLNYSTVYEQLRIVLNDDIKIDDEDNPMITYPTMRYRPSASIRGQLGYKTSGPISIFGEIELTRLTAAEACQIELASTPQDPTKYSNTIEGEISAKEQRTDILLGLHYALGSADEKHIFLEAGANITNTKVVKHELIINSFKRSLISYSTTKGTVDGIAGTPNEQGGTGVGGFADLGYNIPINEKFSIQIVCMYSAKSIKYYDSDSGLTNHFTLSGRVFF